MRIIVIGYVFLTALVVGAKNNLVLNGNMSSWATDSNLPNEFMLGTNATNTPDFFSKSEETYNGLNAIKQTFRSGSSSSSRYFTTTPIYLLAGNYLLTFYVKGNGWFRSVNLSKNGVTPNSLTSSEDNIVGTPMGTSFTAKIHHDWIKYSVKYSISFEDEYVLCFAHNNVIEGSIMHLANIRLEEDNFPENTQLSSLLIEGKVINDFSPEKYIYNYKLPYETLDQGFPQVGYESQEGTTVVQTNASNLSGNETERTATVVASRNGQSLTYKIIFSRGGSPDDARMEEINIDGIAIENFRMDTYVYHQFLPYSATDIPVINGQTIGTGSFSVNNATSLVGTKEQRTTTVNCISGDGTKTNVYQITFEILPKLDLYLCIGQSNMLGRGYMSESDGDFEPLENTYLLTHGFNWEMASNPFNKYSTVSVANKSREGISPSYGFALNIKDRVQGPVGLIVNAKGGTSIQQWTKGNSAGLYEAAIERAKETQKWGKYKAILWHQGESNSSNSSAYPNQLKQLVSDIRKDLKEPDLFFVAGELAYWRGGGTGSTAFNTMIRTITSFLPNSDYVSAEGLTPLIDEKDPHFDRESNIELGRRYAVKVLDYIYGIKSNIDERNTDKVTISVNRNQFKQKNFK